MKKSKFLVSVLGTFMFLNMYSANVFAEDVQAPEGYVIVSAEKFVLGEGFCREPEKIPFFSGDSGEDIADRFFGKENLNGSKGAGSYIASVKDNAGSSEVQIPQYILEAIEKDGRESISSRADSEWLAGSDYYSTSGWIYRINNEVAMIGQSDYIPEDGDVLRYEFSLYEYGADIGADNSSWGGAPAIITEADRDELYKLMADTKNNSAAGEAYNKALAAASKIDASDDEIEKAMEELKSAVSSQTVTTTVSETTSALASTSAKTTSAGASSSPKTGEDGMGGIFAAFAFGTFGIILGASRKKTK